MPNTKFTKRLLIVFLLAFCLFQPIKAEASFSTFYNDYIIDPLADIFIDIFNLSDATPVQISINTTTQKIDSANSPQAPKPTTTPPQSTSITTTLPPNSELQIRGSQGVQGYQGPKGDKGDTGPQGPRGERGPAGSSANFDTSNFVDSVFFDKQVDGILGSIENGVSGLSESLGEEVNTITLNVSGDGTISGSLTVTGGIVGNVATATALAANGANCAAGLAPLGVDASGAAEDCTDFEEDLVNSAGLISALSDETGTGFVVFNTSPTFAGTVTIPTPFTLGATSVTSTGTQLNYLNAATGTTGTTSTNLVFSTSPTLVTPVLGVASGTSLTLTENIELATTTTSSTGVITKGGIRFLHNHTAASTAGGNTFLGIFAGNFTMARSVGVYEASRNTGIGYATLAALTTGYGNTAVGNSAADSLTTGASNIAIGYFALDANQSGSANVVIGNAAGATTSGSGNVMIGDSSGYFASSGENNVLIGRSPSAASYSQVTTGSRNISIGYNVAIASATADDQLNIGNLIYGTGLSGTGATISTGNIGIGIKAPSAALEVTNGATAKGIATFYDNATPVFTIADGGNATFTGTVTIPTPFTLGATSVTSTGTQLNYLNAATGTTGTTSTNLVFSTSPTLVTPILGTPTSVTLTNATGLPASAVLAGTFGTGAYVMDTSLQVPLVIGSTSTTGDLTLQTTSGIGATGADMHFLVGNNGATEAMTILNNGNVGVGTSNPSSTFNVVGKSTFDGITPTLVATIATDSSSQATGSGGVMLDVQGNYAYVINPVASTMQIFDISTPTSPVLISTTAGVGNSAIAVQGHYAYTAVECGNLIIVDVSNPYAPTLRGQSAIAGCAEGIFVSGKYVYVPGILGNGWDNIIDVSNPDAPFQTATFNNFSSASDMYVQGRYLYDTGLKHIYDISNPGTLNRVYTGAAMAGNVAVEGRYAYGGSGLEFRVIDISNPTAPVQVGTVSGASNMGSMRPFIQGNYAYIVNSAASSTLTVVDISVPTAPTIVTSISTGGDTAGIPIVQGRYLYIKNRGSSNLQVFDLGGVYAQQLEAGGVSASSLSLLNSLEVGNNANIVGSLSVGQSANVMGGFSVSGSNGSTPSLFNVNQSGLVGIGTAAPTGNLSITQTTTATGALKGIVYTGAVNTNQTLSTEIPSLTLTTAGREWATGALTTQREVLITQPTYSFVGASTITDAATMGVAGAPIASTNATLTNSHGLLIQAGAVGAGTTNSYGLTVNAQTGATNNYAAAFLGGNVGIGTTAPGALLSLGLPGTTKGVMSFAGNTSGVVTIQPAAAAGTYTLTLPTDDGTSSQYLQTDGNGLLTWASTSLDSLSDAVKDTTSQHNMIIGSELTMFSGAIQNLFIGESAGSAGTSVNADKNIAIGYTALDALTTGGWNTAIGSETLTANTSGFNNLAVGYAAMTTNTIGQNNVANGSFALFTNLDGNDNTVSGVGAMFNNTTGDQNTVMGSGAFSNAVDGSDNVAIGNDAGLGGASASPDNSIFIGTDAGRLITTGGNNVLIGHQAGNSLTTGGSNIVIGYDADVVSGTGSNQLNIGNAIYGTGILGGTVAIGIGTSAPADLLHVTTGNVRIGASTATRSTTAGTNQVVLFDGTAPVGTLTNGISLYSDTGELRVMDAAGNNTLLSPHEDENNYWVFDSTNTETGKSLLIDMEEMMKRLNDTFGWDFVHETIDGIDLDAEPSLELPDTFFGSITDRMVAWFADASNGIGDFFADAVYTKELCITKSNGENFCINGDQLEALVGSGGSSGGNSPAPEPDSTPSTGSGQEGSPQADPIPEPAPTETCSDGIQNQDETDVDTGGICTPAEETPAETPTCTEPQVLVDNVCTDPAPEPAPEPIPEVVPAPEEI